MNKAKLRRYLAGGYLVVSLVLILFVLKLPMYWLIVAYVGFAAILAVFSRDEIVGYMGNMRYAQGRTQDAIRIFDKAIARGTKNPAVYLNRAIIMLNDGDGKNALPYLEKSLELKPNVMTEKNALLSLGSCYWILGDIDKAVDVLESMRNKFDYVNSHVLVTLGYLYIVKENYDEAERISRLAIEDNAGSGSAWDNMGQIQFRRGDKAAAKQSFLKAVELKSDLVDSYYYLGLIAESEGDKAGAAGHFTKAAKCSVSALNTVSKEQVLQKAAEYK